MAYERKYNFGLVAQEMEHFIENELKTVLGVTAVNFFRSNFMVEGFQDGAIKKWKPLNPEYAKEKGPGKKILTDTGDLKRSIRWEATADGVLIIADEPYAEIHNEGGKIVATVSVSAHNRKTKWGIVKVKAHTRDMNTTIPQRQYMGNSVDLEKKLEDAVSNKIHQILDKGQIQ